MSRIDLALSVKLTPQNYEFEKGAEDFLALLMDLRRVPGFEVDWNAQWAEAGPSYSAWNDKADYLKKIREHNGNRRDGFSIWADEASNQRLFYLDYSWNNQALSSIDRLLGEIYHPHPQYGTQAQLYIDLIEAVTTWKRPQHLAFGPMVYMRDHHPLDRARVGIRWMGWLPFALNPSDVPEAELVRPMNGGTLVVTQSQFWQAWEANPDHSRAAIERAQEVEIRLNLLGVLPTNIELVRGDWGQQP
ncbi:Imm52 family immunity protein [Paracoccus fistulariae]|uniref:Immunity 52 family protein n=1 Tax=Paracoccus fistulariae TaxID=658446 RepID=A0ABY7SHJ0_9RHOB|nr:Imm52 family immunity protein [Paracoccus fistulariae]MDB6181078.1 Imm52 family immunity protein [Paracoccus fistulariae]WCR06370.1 immunity 52 family protein [Paracoccus fistulariae]